MSQHAIEPSKSKFNFSDSNLAVRPRSRKVEFLTDYLAVKSHSADRLPMRERSDQPASEWTITSPVAKCEHLMQVDSINDSYVVCFLQLSNGTRIKTQLSLSCFPEGIEVGDEFYWDGYDQVNKADFSDPNLLLEIQKLEEELGLNEEEKNID